MGAITLSQQDLADLDVEVVRRKGLAAFIKIAWHKIDPAPYVHSWHIEEIAIHLEAVYRGEIKNLLINVPPGMSKSSVVNVLWPLWCWIQEPTLRWIFASNDQKLANRDALKVRELMMDPWWKRRWPHVAVYPKSDAIGDYKTTAQGQRLSVGIGTRILGQHANIRVIDDPNKPQGIDGPVDVTARDLERPIDWYTGTLSGRNVDVKTTRTVCIMQRLHENDLAGFLLDQSKNGGQEFVHLNLPMEFERETRCVTSIGGDRRTEEGELLCPSRVDAEALVILKGLYQNNARKIEAQLQQRPSPKGGNIIKSHWLRHWGPCSADCKRRNCPGPIWDECPPVEQMREQSSWDLAFDGKDTSSFVVGQRWGEWNGYLVLLGQKRGQWTFSETLDKFTEAHTEWPRAYKKLVEDKANAKALENVLKSTVPGITLVEPEGQKDDRLMATEPLYEAGYVVYPSPRLFPWVEQVNFHEILGFPTARHNDTVDTTTQFLKPYTKGNRSKRLAAANAGAREFFAQIGRAT